ncbi:hypothetical protein CL630_02200 [bacterium]|nr:hypothetical protein [bacterium]
MRKLIFTFITLVALIVVPVTAHAQVSSIFGNATILYSADKEVLKAAVPLNTRMVVNHYCPHKMEFGKGSSLREIFEKTMADMPKKKKERIILQIALLFDEGDAVCAALWFAYTEK